MIYIYNGSGANDNCVSALETSLKDLCGAKPHEIVKCDFSAPLPNAARILIPGGNAFKMGFGHFSNETAQKVETLVRNGAQGFFSCAGSYVMAGNITTLDSGSKISFTNLSNQVSAFCPAYPSGEQEPRDILIISDFPFYTFWHMGPSYITTESTEVLAYYTDTPENLAACIKIGNAVHSGVHPEISRLKNDEDKLYQDELLSRMFGLS